MEVIVRNACLCSFQEGNMLKWYAEIRKDQGS